MNGVVIISLGGSLIVPDDIDTDFLHSFRNLILKHAKRQTFVIACGGGRTCRDYQAAARDLGILSKDELDWLGIHAARLNGHLVRYLFGRHAHPQLVTDPGKKITAREKILVAAGWKPGWSTDYMAVMLAKRLGAKAVINLTNVDYVYDKNPREHKDAKPFKQMAWRAFRKIISEPWKPGMHAPFDPVAARLAEKFSMEVAVINGKRLHDVENYLEGKVFVGTRIR